MFLFNLNRIQVEQNPFIGYDKQQKYMTRWVEFTPLGNCRIFDGTSYIRGTKNPMGPFTCVNLGSSLRAISGPRLYSENGGCMYPTST